MGGVASNRIEMALNSYKCPCAVSAASVFDRLLISTILATLDQSFEKRLGLYKGAEMATRLVHPAKRGISSVVPV